MLEQGEFDVFVSDPAEGRKHIHTYVAAPDETRYPCFGELALMYAKPRQASVVAKSEGVLWGLDRANFRRASHGGNLLKVLRSVQVVAPSAPRTCPPAPRCLRPLSRCSY